MENLKYKVAFIFVFFFSTLFCFNVSVFARETCSSDSDCLDSINDNTWSIRNGLSDLSTFVSVDSDTPINLVTQESLQTQVDDFNTNMTQLLQVMGIGFGLLLFATAFNLGLFLYKR